MDGHAYLEDRKCATFHTIGVVYKDVSWLQSSIRRSLNILLMYAPMAAVTESQPSLVMARGRMTVSGFCFSLSDSSLAPPTSLDD